MLTIEDIKAAFTKIQDDICATIEALDQKASFKEDQWIREEGGGGRTRVIQKGRLFEKGGVNFSHVHGKLPEALSKTMQIPSGAAFQAMGVSLVIHPESPKIPITHANIRYFEIEDGTYWFGGGIDLTPIYVVPEDAVFFHQQMKAVCDKHHPSYHKKFKPWCDEYFYIKHRKHMRGVGGIFFDYLKPEPPQSKEDLFAFVCDVGNIFGPTYAEITQRHELESYNEQEKTFQLHRRARYAEFNLVYDRGTQFGLHTNGRTESILMSMPPVAIWEYNYTPTEGSAEARTLELLQPQDWA